MNSLDKIIARRINNEGICVNNDEYWCNKDSNNPCENCQHDLTTLFDKVVCMVCENSNNVEKYNQTVRESPRRKDLCKGYKICYTNAICLFCEECREKAKNMATIPSGRDNWDILDEIIHSIKRE